jgi:hypothetical protein
VVLLWEVQVSVGRIEVGVAAVAIGEPGDRHGADDRPQRSGVLGLDRTVADPVGVFHLLGPLLAQRPQVQLALEHLAQKLPAAPVEFVFEFGVVQRGCYTPPTPNPATPCNAF